MLFAQAAVERAMKIQEVICRALAGTLTWLQAADILGIHPAPSADRKRLSAWRPGATLAAIWKSPDGGCA